MAERRIWWAVPMIAAMMLAACSGVPTSSELNELPDDSLEDVNDAPPNADVPGPRPGASAEETVSSFVETMLTYRDGVKKAPQFFTEAATDEWDPTVVQIVKYQIVPTDDGRTLEYTLIGKVVDGVYQVVPNKEVEHELELRREEGELRITNPPEGMIMTERDFDRDFRLYSRYYWDPSFTYLVPDPVYLPAGNKTQTLLANALLDGPSDALGPGVVSAFPDGTELTANTAPVERGTVEINLSAEASQAADEQREQMAAQLAWTLTEVSGVIDVLAKSTNSLLRTEDPVAPSHYAMYSANRLTRSPDTPLYGLTRKGVSALDADGALTRVDGPLGNVPGATDLAVSPLGEQAAVVDAEGSVVSADLKDGAKLRTVSKGTNLSSLAWDPLGTIWGVQEVGDERVAVAMNPSGEPITVEIAGRDGRDVDALAVSPDGTRLAVVLDGVAEIRTIVRADGASGPIEAVNPVKIDESVIDVAWADAVSLAMIVEVPGQPNQARVAGLTRDERGYDLTGDTATVAAAPGQRNNGLVVANTNGDLIRPDDNLSEPVVQLHAPTYPG